METSDEMNGFRMLLEMMGTLLVQLQKTQEKKIWDSADVKRYLNISDKTLYRLRAQKKIPFTRLGEKYYYAADFFLNLQFDLGGSEYRSRPDSTRGK